MKNYKIIFLILLAFSVQVNLQAQYKKRENAMKQKMERLNYNKGKIKEDVGGSAEVSDTRITEYPSSNVYLFTPHQRAENITKLIDKVLHLNQEEYAEVLQLHDDLAIQMDDIRKQPEANNENWLHDMKALLNTKRDFKMKSKVSGTKAAIWDDYINLSHFKPIAKTGRLIDEPELYERWLLYEY